MTYLEIFKEICSIPRPSHHEGAIADYLCNFAKEHSLKYRRDANNCVVIEKPASPDCEDKEPIVILNHMDMVCVAEAGYPVPGPVTPIEYEENGERWMKADHTSLGADNGIGLSMALAILADDTIKHPALEVVTTTCEEDDMSGAAKMAPDFFKGKRILNIDSEAYSEITTASAGAHIQVAHIPYKRIAMPKDYVTFNVSVTGGQGGHSGVDINKGRANAIKILCNLLLVAIRQINIKLYLINIRGGQAYSAIPCEAEAKICIPKDSMEDFALLISQCSDAITAQYHDTDADVSIKAVPSVWHAPIINEEGTHLILASVNGIPSGPVQMREDGIVETSNNIGIIETKGDNCTISTHTRSFSQQAMDELSDNISKIFTLTGAKVESIMHVSPWQEDLEHEWIKEVMGTFEKELGFSPTPVSMHFALEAGYLVEKFQGIHIASIGPRILYPHSPNEKISLTTADNIWRVVREICGTSTSALPA